MDEQPPKMPQKFAFHAQALHYPLYIATFQRISFRLEMQEQLEDPVKTKGKRKVSGSNAQGEAPIARHSP